MKKIILKTVLIVLLVVFVLFLLFVGIVIADASGVFDRSYDQFYSSLDIKLERNTDVMRAPFTYDSIKIIDSASELGIYAYMIPSKYDDEYFESNALVLVSVETSSGSNRVVPTMVKVRNNKMTVKYEIYAPGTGTCDMGYWYIIVECGKEEAANLDKIEVYEGFIKVDELTK